MDLDLGVDFDQRALDELGRTRLGWQTRSVPDSDLALADLARRRWRLRDDDVLYPAAALRAGALDHNIALMRAYCDGLGVGLAPHAKTHMSPQILARQAAAGLEVVTVANVSQARVFHAYGFRRFLIANQVEGGPALAWIAQALEDDQADITCLVDDPSAAVTMNAELQRLDCPRPLGVLLEVGYQSGRAGVRSLAQAVALAQQVDAATHLQLAGVEGFEGLIATPGLAGSDELDGVRCYLESVLEVARELERRNLYGTDQVVLTAGGSAYFDLVAEQFAGLELDRPTTTLLRSGCYVTHDHGTYRRASPLDGRRDRGTRLTPALQVWASVLSRPEPGHVVIGMGKRDVGIDAQLPRPVAAWRDGEPIRLDDRTRVTTLNDQHAMLEVPASSPLRHGDHLVFGVSHPCSTFDRWPLLFVIDDEDTVIDGVLTFF